MSVESDWINSMFSDIQIPESKLGDISRFYPRHLIYKPRSIGSTCLWPEEIQRRKAMQILTDYQHKNFMIPGFYPI